MRLGVLGLVTASACGFGVPNDGTPVDGIDAPPSAIDAPQPDAGPAKPGCTPVELRANASHTCLRREDGGVYCWGYNEYGQLGVAPVDACPGGVLCNFVPTAVAFPGSGVTATAIGLGDRTGCASGAGGTFCWGDNTSGELGNGLTAPLVTPTAIVNRAGAIAIGGGDRHLCSQHANQLECAGLNTDAAVGDGTLEQRTTPVMPAIGAPILSFSSGYRHVCAIANTTRLYCWGDNGEGQTHDEESTTISPREVMLGEFAFEVAAAEEHTCAILADAEATVRCWGDNSDGQLGNGSTGNTDELVDPGLTGVASIRAGADHTCVLHRTGEVRCWGGARFPDAPTMIDLGMPAVAIAAGAHHDCAILADDTVRCWGSKNYGQLGNGDAGGGVDAVPVAISYSCP